MVKSCNCCCFWLYIELFDLACQTNDLIIQWTVSDVEYQTKFGTDKYRNNFYRVSQKKLSRNVAVFLLRGFWAVKIWVFWGAECIYAITRCIAYVPIVSTFVWTPISCFHTSEWPFDQRFCYFPKDNFFGGHPVRHFP